MYWRHVRLGKTRFLIGLLVLAAASYVIGAGLAESRYRSVWDIAPATLAKDRSEPAGCGAPPSRASASRCSRE